MDRNWYRSQERKNNNKGVSLVMVLVTIAIVLILVTVILTIAMMNYRMKSANTNSVKTFYSAEQAVDEIRAGLVLELSGDVAETYNDIMTNFSKKTEDERQELFGKRLDNLIRKHLEDGSGTGLYRIQIDVTQPNLPAMQAYVSKDLYDASNPTKTDVVEVTTPDVGISNRMNFDVNHKYITLKNIKVTYYGKANYVSTIKTDIVLNYPNIDFNKSSAVPQLLSYSIVANRQFLAGANMSGGVDTGVTDINIRGNAYLGKEGCLINNSNVSFNQKKEDSMLITGATMQLSNNASVDITDSQLWTRDLLVDSSTFTLDGTAYLANDVTLANKFSSASTRISSNLTMKGKLYGFGNPEYAKDATSTSSEMVVQERKSDGSVETEVTKDDDIMTNPANYSSSIIVNGPKPRIDLQGLQEMLLSGTAYINAKEKNTALASATNQNTENVVTGESISVRRNQTAYLVPTECVSPDSVNGNLNPMTADKYQNLLAEKGAGNLVDYNRPVTGLGKTLAEMGVNSYQVEWYPVNRIGSMAYLFMKFDDQKAADRFFAEYFDPNRVEESARLKQNLNLYTSALLLPPDLETDKTSGQNHFYYNGNVVLRDVDADQNPMDTAGKFQTATLLETDNNETAWKSFSIEKEDNFAALNHKLILKYSDIDLAKDENKKDVYDNLVYPMDHKNGTVQHPVTHGKTVEFFTHGIENLAAVVTNGDYVINSTDILDSTGRNARLCLIIATGDITVNTDFSGTIIAKGKVRMGRSRVSVATDASAVAQALFATDSRGATPAEYLKNASSYTAGGSGSGSEVSISELVKYDNWSKDKE